MSVLALQPGDAVLLCSDGLHGEVADQRIGELFALAAERAAHELVHAALDAGGRDNVTAVVLKAQ